MIKNVLDHGYVELVDYMGSDIRILEAARVSTGSEVDKGEAKNKGLIKYLIKNKHGSPLEKVVFEFKIHMPIFVMRQWSRHRMSSFNEKSARYTKLSDEYYIPGEFRVQGVKNHQGSGEGIDKRLNTDLRSAVKDLTDVVYDQYENMLELGVTREQARANLPVSMYTTVFWTVNLRSLMNFLNLRMHDHAQQEIRVYADAISEILESMEELKYTMPVVRSTREVDWLLQEALNLDKSDDLNGVKEVLQSYISSKTT